MRTSIIKRRSILCLLLVFIMAFVFAAVSCADGGDSGSSDVSQSESTSETTSESGSDVADKGLISVKDKTKTLYVGETYKIEATSEGMFAYGSTDENVATVTADGVVTALSDGIAFIKVSDGKTFVNVKISVIKSEEYIRLGATEIGFVKGGERTVNAEVIKNGEVSDDEITFSCDDAAIKLVKNGKSVTISSDKTGNYVVVASCGDLRAEIAVKVVSDSSKMLDSTKSTVENCTTLKWSAVENASGYQVAVNGGEWTDVDGTTFDVHAYTDGLKYGETVVFAVRAVAKNNFDFFDSLPERAAFSHNYKETVIEAYTCVTAGKVKYACADCGKEYEQDGVLAPHSIKNGACEVCGKIITEKILYVYDEANECYYVGGTDAGFDSEEVYILAEYNDGKNGNHPVKYFGVSAFTGNDIIRKIVIPASITEFKDVRGEYNNINKNGEKVSSPLRGLTFDGCTDLEFVSMEGITYLPAIDRLVICDKDGNFVRIGSEENLTEEDKNKGYTAKVIEYYHDNFRDCYNLTTVIVGNGYYNAGRNWMKWQNTPADEGGNADIYVNGSVVDIATGEYPIGSSSGANNNLLSGDIFTYVQDSTKCFTWYYDENGNFVSNGKHDYNKNGVCRKCYAVNDYGVKYRFDGVSKTYYVSGYAGSSSDVNVRSKYDDGINGEHDVTFVKFGAFQSNEKIKKVVLPETVTELDGCAFLFCSNLEYVDMRGVAELKKTTLGELKNAGKRSSETYPDNDYTWRNFEGCVNLKTIIVGNSFKVDERMFHNSGNGATVTIYTTASSDTEFALSIDRSSENNNNNLLSDNVFYKGDPTQCDGWDFDEIEGIVYGSGKHRFVDGKCVICGKYNTAGVLYGYDGASNTYYVSGYAGSLADVTVIAKYDDGTHGEAAVTFVKFGAFRNNATIKKVVLPETITELDGCVFLFCSNLEYIDMRGVAELKKTTLGELKNAGKRSNETYPDNDFTWRNFEGCSKLKTVIVGKTFKVDARMFHSDGVATASIFTTATSESDFTLTIDRSDAGNNNNILSDKVLYKGDTSSCGYWNFDENGNILQASHDFVDGKCTICGEYNTAGVIYGYDTVSKTYYVTGYEGSSANVTVLAKYSDGTHGEAAVTFVKAGAFQNNNKIKKVILPETVTELDGCAFLFCSNLEYVDMRGVTELKKTTLGDLKNAGKRSKETYPDNDFTWRNFEGCVKLSTIIVGSTFKVEARMFHDDSVSNVVKIYTTAANKSAFTLTIDRTTDSGNNNLLSDRVFYKGDNSRCDGWDFDENGNLLRGSGEHDFVDGKCTICGTYNAAGVVYGYDGISKSYYVAGCESSLTEVIVLDKFDDGEHGEAAVTFVKFGAFMNNAVIKKVILGKNITTLDGCVFLNCPNLEYVSMEGVEELKKTTLGESNRGSVYDFNDFTWRNFEGCTKLTAIVVGKRFAVGARMFHGDAMGTVKIYTTAANAEEFTLTIDRSDAGNNNNLLSDSVYYFSETEVSGAWHYVNGAPTLWA